MLKWKIPCAFHLENPPTELSLFKRSLGYFSTYISRPFEQKLSISSLVGPGNYKNEESYSSQSQGSLRGCNIVQWQIFVM